MSDDLVKRLRELAGRYDEAAERIEELEAGEIEFDRVIGNYASENAQFRDRIEKLEAALLDLCDGWECCAVSRSMRAVARKALEGKDE